MAWSKSTENIGFIQKQRIKHVVLCLLKIGQRQWTDTAVKEFWSPSIDQIMIFIDLPTLQCEDETGCYSKLFYYVDIYLYIYCGFASELETAPSFYPQIIQTLLLAGRMCASEDRWK
jgi:hypothetical protein